MIDKDRYAHFYTGLVRKPVTLFVVFVALLVVGLIAYMRIPVQMMPDGIVEPGLQVWASNPGASAQENEDKLARVIEEQIRTLTGVKDIESTSSSDFVSIWIQFDADVDMDLAKADVRDRIERARPQLPSTVDRIGVFSWSNENMPIIFFALLHPGDSPRTDFLIDTVVQRRLEAVDGVGKLDIWGVLDDSMRIELDEDKVRAANLDLGELVTRLGRDNFALPMGEVNDGGRRILLRSDMRFKDPEEIAAFPIGDGLRLGDIARVEPVKSVRNRLFKIDGQPAYYGEVQKDSQSNVVATCHRVKAALKELEKDPRLAGEFKFLPLFDQGEFIETSLDQLRDSALWGGGLAVLVLFAFLRRVRSTLAVALAIPFSVLVAVGWLYFTGGTFNVLTMTGITLAIGMLVDDAVVVIENIARLRSEGEPRMAAAARGTREVALAVMLSTLTTIVVFLPLIFISENPILRIMFAELGSPLCLSLMASLLAALVFLPVVAARIVVDRHPMVERVAGWIEPLTSAPARICALGYGAVRGAVFAVARGLHPIARFTATAVTRLRWALALLLVALVAWNAWRAFAPMMLLTGIEQSFAVAPKLSLDDWLMLAIEVSAAPLALAIVVFLVPHFAARLGDAPTPPQRFVPHGRSLVEFVVHVNHALVAWTLRHPILASLAAFLAALSAAWPQTHMHVTPFGEDENTGRLSVFVELEENFTLAEAEQEMSHYEEFFAERRDKYRYDHLADRFDLRSGRITLYWDIGLARDEYKAIEREVRENLVARPGHRLRFGGEDQVDARDKNVVTFRMVGPDSEQLGRIGERAIKTLETIPGLHGVQTRENEAQSQVRVVFDSDIAQGFGITPNAALQNIAWALRGWQLPRYQEEDREIPLIIEYDDQQVAGLGTLRDLDVFGGQSAVPLSSFAQFQFAHGERAIERRNGQTSYTITARVDDPLRQKELSDAGYAALKSLDLPRGYSVGEEDLVGTRQEQELTEILFAFALAMVLAYIVMAILFESFLLPFTVMFTVPYGMVGAFWTLYLTGTAMDSVGWIGVIILVGVVVKNGIVLIDCVQRLRDEGIERSEAVLRGCALRVRPVLMTALATVIGLIPIMIAEPASEGIDYRALATCVAGGLAVSTVFTLWVVPLAYVLFDDFTKAIAKRTGANIRWLAGFRRVHLPLVPTSDS